MPLNLRFTHTGLFIDAAGKVGIGTDPSNILHIKSANPVLTIQDTETGLSSADSRIRLVESGGSGAVENYWDIKANTFYSNFSFDVQSSGSNFPTVNMAQTGNLIGINTGSAAGYQVRVRGANLGTTAGDTSYQLRLFSPTANDANLDIYDKRHSNGSSWTTTEKRIEYNVDSNASKTMWISFIMSTSTTDNIIRFGEADNTEWMRIDNGSLLVNNTELSPNGTAAYLAVGGRSVFDRSSGSNINFKILQLLVIHQIIELKQIGMELNTKNLIIQNQGQIET